MPLPDGSVRARPRPRPRPIQLPRPAQSFLARRMAQWSGHTPSLAPAPQPPSHPFDFTNDATYQRIRALGQRNVAGAEAEALQLRKQLAIELGDPDLAPDEQTRAAASANQFSRMAVLGRRRAEEPRALESRLSAQNLGYSGAGAKQQSDLVRSLMEDETNIRSFGRSRLGEIEGGLRSAREQAADLEAQAQEEAAARLRERLGDLPVGPRPGEVRQAPGLAPVRSQLVRRLLQPSRPAPRPSPTRRPGYRP